MPVKVAPHKTEMERGGPVCYAFSGMKNSIKSKEEELMETESTNREQLQVAQLRFGLIAPLIQGTYPDASMSAYCRRVAAHPVQLPDGRMVQYKPKTLGKWVNLYNRGGMDALVPKTRCDKGGSRVITQDAEL